MARHATTIVFLIGLSAFLVIILADSGPTADWAALLIGATVGVAAMFVSILLMFVAISEGAGVRNAVAVWAAGMVLGPAAVTLSLTSIPSTVRFELSRGALDAAAREALTSAQPPKPGWIGLYPIVQITRESATRVEFDLAVDPSGYPTGFVYVAPNSSDSPASPRDYEMLGEDLRSGWWTIFDPNSD